MSMKQKDDNQRYKTFIKDHEEKNLWSRRKKDWERKYPKIFESTAKSVLGKYKEVNDIFDYDRRGINDDN